MNILPFCFRMDSIDLFMESKSGKIETLTRNFSMNYLVPLWLTSSSVMQETQVSIPLSLDQEPESVTCVVGKYPQWLLWVGFFSGKDAFASFFSLWNRSRVMLLSKEYVLVCISTNWYVMVESSLAENFWTKMHGTHLRVSLPLMTTSSCFLPWCFLTRSMVTALSWVFPCK